MRFPSDAFSGVVRIGEESWAFGFADRAHEIPNTVDTRFAVASGAPVLAHATSVLVTLVL